MTLVLNGTTGISSVDGSAATPAVQGNDTNTGVFFPAADTVALSTGGTERMRVDSSGNVGIGTSSPAYKLSFGAPANGTKSIALYENGAGNGFYGIGNDANRMTFYTGNTSGGAERMAIDSNGNVGIGTVPQSKFEVLGAVSILRNTSPSGYTSLRLYNDQNNPVRALEIDYFGSTASGGERAEITTTGAYPLAFLTSNSERMRIDSSGKVLVGTSSTFVGANSLQVASSLDDQIAIRSTNAVAGRYWRFSADGNNTVYIINQSSAGVYIGNGGTAWSSLSDERTKDIIEPITDAANKVSSLRAVIGKYKTDEEGKRRSFLIAQDVEAVLPEAVSVANQETGYLGLSYTEVIPLLVAAIKELTEKNTALEARIAALEA